MRPNEDTLSHQEREQLRLTFAAVSGAGATAILLAMAAVGVSVPLIGVSAALMGCGCASLWRHLG
ncbi:MAG: hypothetical protein H6739_21435 [Alphaproteobacteria bacterium]|nr:hypothetical protein [Alphaproteobacteria bacterium]